MMVHKSVKQKVQNIYRIEYKIKTSYSKTKIEYLILNFGQINDINNKIIALISS